MKKLLWNNFINHFFCIWSIKSDAQLEVKGGGLSCPFLKIEKCGLILKKKGPDSVYLWVKFSIQNLVLRVSRRKNSKCFPCWVFCSCFLTKNFWLRACKYRLYRLKCLDWNNSSPTRSRKPRQQRSRQITKCKKVLYWSG